MESAAVGTIWHDWARAEIGDGGDAINADRRWLDNGQQLGTNGGLDGELWTTAERESDAGAVRLGFVDGSR
jgi:hypothetical protein